jgi:3-oxoadipate enol-lactonase
MPFVNSGAARLYYRLEGREDRPALVLSHSLGADHGMWAPQAPELLDHFRLLRYDTRGHGASGAPPGDYTIEQLGRDMLAIADAAGLAEFAFCGLSLGGMTGMWIAANAPDRVSCLVLANTSAKFPDPSVMENRRQSVLARGMASIADSVMQRFFSADALAANNPQVATTRATLLATDPGGYAGCCAAVRDTDNRGLLAAIRAETLLIVGDKDLSTPWAGHGEHLAAEIPRVKTLRLPAAHLSNIERPRSFSWALLDFLAGSAGDGMAMRRDVMGDPYVDRAVADAKIRVCLLSEYAT